MEQQIWLKYASPAVLAAVIAKTIRDSGVLVEGANPRGPIVLRIEANAMGSNGIAFTRRVVFRLDGNLNGPIWRYRVLAWEEVQAE